MAQKKIEIVVTDDKGVFVTCVWDNGQNVTKVFEKPQSFMTWLCDILWGHGDTGAYVSVLRDIVNELQRKKAAMQELDAQYKKELQDVCKN